MQVIAVLFFQSQLLTLLLCPPHTHVAFISADVHNECSEGTRDMQVVKRKKHNINKSVLRSLSKILLSTPKHIKILISISVYLSCAGCLSQLLYVMPNKRLSTISEVFSLVCTKASKSGFTIVSKVFGKIGSDWKPHTGTKQKCFHI